MAVLVIRNVAGLREACAIDLTTFDKGERTRPA